MPRYESCENDRTRAITAAAHRHVKVQGGAQHDVWVVGILAQQAANQLIKRWICTPGEIALGLADVFCVAAAVLPVPILVEMMGGTPLSAASATSAATCAFAVVATLDADALPADTRRAPGIPREGGCLYNPVHTGMGRTSGASHLHDSALLELVKG